MLVGTRMSTPIITLPSDTPIHDALILFKQENIRRAPVIDKGKLVGIISEEDLLNASPSQATSLSIWEMNYLLSKIKVSDVMTKVVHTVTEDTPIEEAAKIMVDNSVGGLPVMRGSEVVGMVTETDLFKIFLELMGARDAGVRVTALIEEKPGQLARLGELIASKGGNFITFGQFEGETPENSLVTFKVVGMKLEEVKQAIQPVIQKLVDIRE
ncbi:MAG: CBS domain-containing protein [Anaerolineales bacterium]|nr:CBS domain-containing protein [Anaerolineales bacterium]